MKVKDRPGSSPQGLVTEGLGLYPESLREPQRSLEQGRDRIRHLYKT